MKSASGREVAYEHLRTQLLTNPALAGTFLNEQEVADTLSVSRTPVREALLLLSVEGLVTLVPNRGAFVPPVTPEQIRHILQARTVLETWAATQVLRDMKIPLTELNDCLERQRAMIMAGPPEEFIRVDRDFHFALINAAGNPIINQMYESVRARHVVVGVAAIERTPTNRALVVDEHEAIVEALSGGDEATAVQAVRSHLLRTATRHASP